MKRVFFLGLSIVQLGSMLSCSNDNVTNVDRELLHVDFMHVETTEPDSIRKLKSLKIEDRLLLLNSVLFVTDGMNERGVSVALADCHQYTAV